MISFGIDKTSATSSLSARPSIDTAVTASGRKIPMRVVVHVAEEHLREVSFERYATGLGSLIGEGHQPDECDIS